VNATLCHLPLAIESTSKAFHWLKCDRYHWPYSIHIHMIGQEAYKCRCLSLARCHHFRSFDWLTSLV